MLYTFHTDCELASSRLIPRERKPLNHPVGGGGGEEGERERERERENKLREGGRRTNKHSKITVIIIM